ncbi:hypothetical protein Tco_0506105 [Tanacetum coccineum]
MGFVKKSIAERTRYKREYESMVNERQLQTQEGKVDMVKALDVNLAVTESSGTESVNQYESDSSRNDTFIDDANIKPTYDEEPMAELYLAEDSSTSALQVLRRSSSIFTSVYVAVQKLKKTLARASVQLG